MFRYPHRRQQLVQEYSRSYFRGVRCGKEHLLTNRRMRGLKPEGNIDQAKALWSEIENDLGSNIGHFVKHYATHRYRTSSQSGLSDYQTIRLQNKGLPTQELLFDIRKKATYYCKLINPVIGGDESNCTETEYMVYSFFKKRRHEQIRPVLLSLIHQKELNTLSNDAYEQAILFLYDFFICYNIIGQENSNKITNTVYSMANEFENNFSDQTLQRLISKLNGKLPNKDSFISAFSLVGWSHHGGFYDDDKDKERVQIILEVLERHKSASGRCDGFTIEHNHATAMMPYLTIGFISFFLNNSKVRGRGKIQNQPSTHSQVFLRVFAVSPPTLQVCPQFWQRPMVLYADLLVEYPVLTVPMRFL